MRPTIATRPSIEETGAREREEEHEGEAMWELTITLGAGVLLAGSLVGAWLFAGWIHTRHRQERRHHPWH